jgi:hypothetical protein
MSEEDLEIIGEVCFDSAYLVHALIQILDSKGIITKKEIATEANKIKMETECNSNGNIN